MVYENISQNINNILLTCSCYLPYFLDSIYFCCIEASIATFWPRTVRPLSVGNKIFVRWISRNSACKCLQKQITVRKIVEKIKKLPNFSPIYELNPRTNRFKNYYIFLYLRKKCQLCNW